MVAPASYGWNTALVEAVANGETVDVPAHDINDNVDQNTVEVALDGDVLADDEFDISFDVAGKKVVVTNLSTEEWDAQSNLYVSCSRKALAGSGGEAGAALEARIAALEAQGQDHETRIAALEAAEAPAARRR